MLVWKRDEVDALLAGKPGKGKPAPAPAQESGSERDWELERDITRETELGMIAALVEKSEGLDPYEFHGYLVSACREWSIAKALKRRGHADGDSRTDELIAALSPGELQGLVAELVLEADDDTMKAFALSREVKGIEKAAKARVLAVRKAAAETPESGPAVADTGKKARAKKGGA